MGENLVAHKFKHGLAITHPAPVFPAQCLLVNPKKMMRRFAEAQGISLMLYFFQIQQANENQKGYLFDYYERVGNSSRNKIQPQPVYVTFDLVINHAYSNDIFSCADNSGRCSNSSSALASRFSGKVSFTATPSFLKSFACLIRLSFPE